MKNKFFKQLTSILVLVSVFVAIIGFPINIVHAEDEFSVEAAAAIAIDAESGKVFYNQNADEALPIASMTKMITLYLVLEAIHEGKISWEDQVTIDEFLYDMSHDTRLSNVPLEKDTPYTVKDLFDATAIVSANAAASALGIKVAGSEKDFIDLMRNKLQSWGIQDAYIISPSGLNNEFMEGHMYPGSKPDEENTMSAKSMAIVAQHLIKDFPEYLEVTKTTNTVFAANSTTPIEMQSWNWMLPGFDFYKEGVDGLKTGTTDLAGACFTGTITQNGWRLITVVMNATNHDTNSGARFIETSRLMDYVYENWQEEVIYKKGMSLPNNKTLPVSKGKEFSVPIVLNEDVRLWTHKDMNKENLEIMFTPDENLLTTNQEITAPINSQQKIGVVTFSLKEDTLGYVQENEDKNYTMVTNDSVKKANIFVLIGRTIKNFFSNLF